MVWVYYQFQMIMAEYKHAADAKKGRFYFESGGKKMADMVYNMAGDQKMIIEHTEVNESLKGQGIGKNLLANLVAFARANQIKVIPLCPFAAATFRKTTAWQDVLVTPDTPIAG